MENLEKFRNTYEFRNSLKENDIYLLKYKDREFIVKYNGRSLYKNTNGEFYMSWTVISSNNKRYSPGESFTWDHYDNGEEFIKLN